MSEKYPEILAPAGNFEVLKAAVYAGTDAVYVGGTQFNARMNAKNFDRQTLREAIGFCHERGVRLYVALNTLIYDRQMADALHYVDFLALSGVDALILADIGLSVNIKKYFPEMRCHASTQCSGHNSRAAEYLKQMGFDRMVCARELSYDNIKAMTANSPIEIETFVHGALCVSQSGQCLMSSLIGGRSGNRGECAQPCRLPYNGKPILSLKDNCLAGHITQLLDSGVASLKIEGRMKSPDYVYSAVSLYRKLIDEKRNADMQEMKKLMAVFSRQGFTDGYFTGKTDESMLGIRSDDDKNMTMHSNVSIVDRTPERERITKEEPLSRADEIKLVFPKRTENTAKTLNTARFYNPENIPDDAKNFFDIIYLPLDRFDVKKANGVILPPVIPENDIPKIVKELQKAKKSGALHAMVGNIGHISIAEQVGFILHGDYRLNIYNSFSAEKYLEKFEDVILSPELILPQIRDIRNRRSVIVYGRIPLMTLERKLKCDSLRDRRGVVFPVVREGERDIVLNSVPVYMADYADRLENAGIFNRHFIFTDEGKQGSRAIIHAYEKRLPTKKEIRRIK